MEIRRRYLAEGAQSKLRPDHKQAEQAAPEMPSVVERMKHAAGAGTRVVHALANGEEIVVEADEVERRRQICEVCEWWKAEAYLGAGGCAHADCGCTGLKAWLATERCPVGKWGGNEE